MFGFNKNKREGKITHLEKMSNLKEDFINKWNDEILSKLTNEEFLLSFYLGRKNEIDLREISIKNIKFKDGNYLVEYEIKKELKTDEIPHLSLTSFAFAFIFPEGALYDRTYKDYLK